ncbi:ABC transporter permease [uncultured Roseivirga sp.]|uniref:ABC transporter permease n=1 Tax=uncultured Roseivirga sp. TaxID=543088 RepID=UPI000D7B2EB3|nr:ABC transporter permease [uncultured Roseivirga sp.]PWL28629.1 MAG: hypothetical protein DCO95_14840 [Roseivirga sp. XM-24bin3]
MLKHLLNISFRTLKKRPWLHTTNLLGLSVGLSAFALILYYYQYQTSFDDFHGKADRLYRVVMTRYINGEWVSERPDNYPALTTVLNEDIPEIESAQMVMHSQRTGTGILMDFGTEDKPLLRDDLRVLSADPGIFDLYDIEMVSGDYTGLKEPFTGIISAELAQTFYPNENAIGKTWAEDDGREYRIIGVFHPWEKNSHLKFDLIKSFESIGARHGVDFHRTSWDWDRMKVYVLLKDGVSKQTVEDKIDSLLLEYKPVNANLDLKEFLSLQPIQDIKLHSDFEAKTFLAKESNKVNGLLLIGFIILAIAWTNFINFNLSLGFERLKNMGIQKSLGAEFNYFIKKQAVKSLIINVLSLAVALSVWQIFKPLVDELAGIPTDFRPQPSFYLLVFGISVLGVVLTFITPVLVAKRVDVSLALKGKVSKLNFGIPGIRKALVTFQWVVSIVIAVSVFVIQDQLNYLDDVDKGLRTEGVLVFNGPRLFDYDRFSANPEIIKNEIAELPGVISVGSSYAVPGKTPYAYEIREEGKPLAANVFIPEHQVDANYIQVYDHKLLAGRNFDPNRSTDETAAILNVSAVQALFGDISLNDVLGRRITSPENGFIRTVIGVIEDYYHQSPEVAHFPMNFVFDPESRGFYSVRFAGTNQQALLKSIESKYSEVFPGNLFHSFLLEDFYADYQASERNLSGLLTAFGGIAIILSIVGVVALTLLDLGKNMKNLSIRKVLGADFIDLLIKVGYGNLSRFALAAIIAIPLTFWLMEIWLGGYANRIGLGFKHLAPSIILAIILITVLFACSNKALKQNPTQYLKEE